MWLFIIQTNMGTDCAQHSANYAGKKQHSLHVPYSVSGWRGYVDSQHSLEFLHLYCEQEGCVGHFFHLLFDELRLCGFLEVFGLGNLVHKAHDLARLVASNQTVFNIRTVMVKVTYKIYCSYKWFTNYLNHFTFPKHTHTQTQYFVSIFPLMIITV